MSYEDSIFYSSSEKKMKLFKKERKSSSTSNSVDPSLMRSFSQKPSSYGNKSTSSSSMCRSSSLRNTCPESPTKSSSTLMRSFSKKSSKFGKKCTNLAKEQKAKFYIVKRCVSMLVNWPKNKHHGDSD